MSLVPHFKPACIRIALVAVLVTIIGWFGFKTSAQEDLTFGTWSLGNRAPGHLLATHATLLRNNKILVIGGSSYNELFAWGKEDARLYDIAGGTWRLDVAFAGAVWN